MTIFGHSGRSDLLSQCLSQLFLSLKVRPGYFQLKLKKCSGTGSMESDKWEEAGADAASFGTLQEGSLVQGCHFLLNFLGPKTSVFSLMHIWMSYPLSVFKASSFFKWLL